MTAQFDTLLARLQAATPLSYEPMSIRFADSEGAMTLTIGDGVKVAVDGLPVVIAEDYESYGKFVARFHEVKRSQAATPTHKTELEPDEFFGLFTIDEQIDIEEFAEGTARVNKRVAVLLSRLRAPSVKTVNVTNPQVSGGLDMLAATEVSDGVFLLTEERAAEIKLGMPL